MLVAEARSFQRIDNHVVTENLSDKHSCTYLNSAPKAKTVLLDNFLECVAIYIFNVVYRSL